LAVPIDARLPPSTMLWRCLDRAATAREDDCPHNLIGPWTRHVDLGAAGDDFGSPIGNTEKSVAGIPKPCAHGMLFERNRRSLTV
jgi:hypothetical protein